MPGPHTLKIGGNTPCVEVLVNGHLVILDGGTGIIALGNDLLRRARDTGKAIMAVILFSHTHHDHTQGLPYFKPAYIGESVFHIFGPRLFYQEIAEALNRAMLPPNFPVDLADLKSLKVIRNLAESEQIWLLPGREEPVLRNIFRERPPESGDVVRIDVLKSYAHPQEGVFFYKISYRGRSLVYATDTEGYIGGDQRLIRFAQGVDLLIHDAQYSEAEYLDPLSPTQGWGHSTPQMAMDVARAARVKQLLLFHHDPGHSDEQLLQLERELQIDMPGVRLAYEGLEVDLTAL
ncbi:MAG: MBL fold metallo-hydrolase [Ardenticatenaceae bacterium]|nr:MBL fold metallo-hydrolase [Ardenticatenaceae bacterium]